MLSTLLVLNHHFLYIYIYKTVSPSLRPFPFIIAYCYVSTQSTSFCTLKRHQVLFNLHLPSSSTLSLSVGSMVVCIGIATSQTASIQCSFLPSHPAARFFFFSFTVRFLIPSEKEALWRITETTTSRKERWSTQYV